MKVFACFEGVTDIGALEPILKKCANSIPLDIESYTHAALKDVKMVLSKIDRGKKKDDKKFTRLMAIRKLLYLADKNNENRIAYHQDAGHDGFREIYTATKEAFIKADLPDEIKCLAIIPKEMTESWLLADIRAINSLGDGSHPVAMSPNPESLWGEKNDHFSNYPKNYLRRNLQEFGLEDNHCTYAQIAKNTDIEALKRRCPESFGQFYTDMQSFIAEENTP